MKEMDLVRRELTAELFQAGRQWDRIVELAFRAYGISEARAAPLLYTSRLGGGVRQIDLANHIGIRGQSIVRLLDQLTAAGLVQRRNAPGDRRAKTIWLTREGEALVAHLEELLSQTRADVLKNFEQAELKTALRVLEAFEVADPRSRGCADKVGA